MPDVFSNLAAQSLSSIVGIQPLISPLFAPTPQLLSDAILANSNDQPAGAADNAIFANTPSIVADGLIDISEMVQPSKEVLTAEKRAVSPDLVPSDVPQNAISILSVHQLLQPQHLTHDRMEPVSSASPPSSPIATIDEPLSTENTPSVAFPQDDSVGVDLSRPSSMNWPLSGAQGMSFNPPTSQPIQSQEATPHNIEKTGRPPSSLRYDDQKHTAENSSHALATNHEPQHTSPKDHPSTPTGDASHFRYLSPSFDKHVAPLPIQPALPVSFPSLQPDDQSEHIVNGDDVLDQESSALVQPQEQSASIPVRKDRYIATPATVPVQSVISAMVSHLSQELPGAVANINDAHGLEIAADRQRIGQFMVPTASAELAEHVSIPSVSLPSNAQDTLHSPRVTSKQETHRAEEEGEVPPIRITIGRVVVRATPAAQPTPIQKRVLRPAQSLSEYLKQRERGSR